MTIIDTYCARYSKSNVVIIQIPSLKVPFSWRQCSSTREMYIPCDGWAKVVLLTAWQKGRCTGHTPQIEEVLPASLKWWCWCLPAFGVKSRGDPAEESFVKLFHLHIFFYMSEHSYSVSLTLTFQKTKTEQKQNTQSSYLSSLCLPRSDK